jgi:hypothetical protein
MLAPLIKALRQNTSPSLLLVIILEKSVISVGVKPILLRLTLRQAILSTKPVWR